MIRLHPLAARVVAITWVLAGVLLAAAGAVTIVLDGSLARWELLVALVLLAVGLLEWQHEITVDEQGVEQRRAGQRTRLMWSAVTRVEVPIGRALAGPVRVWQQHRDHPDTLPGSWGLSRSQGLRLAEAIRSVTARYDIEVDGPDADDADVSPA
jgi:hypothetical protein